jgi:hypothetical protein
LRAEIGFLVNANEMFTPPASNERFGGLKMGKYFREYFERLYRAHLNLALDTLRATQLYEFFQCLSNWSSDAAVAGGATLLLRRPIEEGKNNVHIRRKGSSLSFCIHRVVMQNERLDNHPAGSPTAAAWSNTVAVNKRCRRGADHETIRWYRPTTGTGWWTGRWKRGTKCIWRKLLGAMLQDSRLPLPFQLTASLAEFPDSIRHLECAPDMQTRKRLFPRFLLALPRGIHRVGEMPFQ